MRQEELGAARAALGRRLSDLRKAAGLTQQQLASATFTSRSSLASIETGRQNPEPAFWKRADEATDADGTLIAAFEDLRMQVRRQARFSAAVPNRPAAAQTPIAEAGHGHQTFQGGPELDFGAVLGLLRTAKAQADSMPVQGRPACIPAERSHELFIRADALLAANDRREVEAAKVLLDRAVLRDPQFAPAIAARGYVSWRQYFAGWAKQSRALANAIDDIHAALAADPGSVVAHLAFVRVCWDMGWHESALAAGRLVFSHHPDSLKATLAFARALNNAGMAEFALPLVDSILIADPTNPAALRLRIWCHLMVGNFGHAVEAADVYLPAHRADANTRWAVALAHYYLADGGKALQTAEEATAADPGDITVWVLLGYLRRHLRGEDAAVESWESGLTHVDGGDISSSRARAWLANLYAALGEERRAMAIVDDLRSQEPGNGYLCYRLAHVLAELRYEDDAVTMLDQAVDCGFLSVQLARCEEALATASLSGADRYRAAMRRLEQRVAACADAYACDILPVPVAGAALTKLEKPMTLPRSDQDWIAGVAGDGIVTIGDPRLKRDTTLVDDPQEVTELLAAMVGRLRDLNGAGLAAPQIGAAVRLVVVEVRRTDVFPDRPETPLLEMINPEIVRRSEAELMDWEGCFSVPGLMGQVPRAKHVTVTFTTPHGQQVTEDYSGYVARVIQHEIDHLDAIEFLDRMRSMQTVTTVQNYLAFHRS